VKHTMQNITPHQTTSPTQADTLRAVEQARIAALLARDMARLEQLHAPQYQLVSPAGKSFTRERYLELISAGTLRYLRWEPQDIHVRVREHMALVRYQATLQLDAEGAGGVPFMCWHIDSYELNNGVWQAVWSQATKIA
jgi:hypothetical protein